MEQILWKAICFIGSIISEAAEARSATKCARAKIISSKKGHLRAGQLRNRLPNLIVLTYGHYAAYNGWVAFYELYATVYMRAAPT